MAISLKLREEKENGQLVVSFDDQIVKTALEQIPAIDQLQEFPFINGQILTAALGGDEMLKRLADDPDNLILLDCDDTADAFAWEFATLPDRQFLCVKAGMLRTVNKTSEVLTHRALRETSEVSGALNFIALAADPLVDEGGNPRDGYRLDLDNEMRSIRETLQNSGKDLTARRIPPTREHLNRALRQGPAVLHLTCHGNVVNTPTGKLAVLALENKDGSIDPLTGADLLNMSPRGVLRMVLLSSCMTATGSQANLARALALNGVPFAVGMQESFPDPLSDDLAVALYDSLFSGLSIGEALRQARMSLARHPHSVGLPVGYVSANGWSEAFPIQQGTPSVGGLGKPGESALGGEIQPPRPLLGRNLELHQIAKHFVDGHKVITVAGTGGMGKTALAAAFAERFAWMWTRGVSGYSFANEVNAANFRYALMRVLFGDEGAQQGASLSESQQREAILKAAREWSGLWLFDNYESIIQGIQEKQPEAESIHRLIADLANGDADLLLTSREQPAGLRNERLFPDGNHALHGLGDEAGVELFFQHSVKAKEDARAHADFALAVQHAADGHPLAIALLAGEYDVSAVPMQTFLGNWEDELTNARRGGLAGHHITFTIAFERSYAHLSKDLQEKLASLSIFPFPFFAHGAVMIWDGSHLPDGKEEIDAKVNAAQQTLSEFTRRSLLEVDATYDDDTPGTYRFQPALRQEATRRLDSSLIESQQVGYAAYSNWFINMAFGEIGKQPPIARLALVSLGELIKNADHQPDDKSARYCWKLGTVLLNLGFMHEADEVLNKGSAIAQSQGDNIWRERILFQQAYLHTLHGEMDKALECYNECAQLAKAENNEGEYSVVIGSMAKIYETRGDFDRALKLYEESLQLLEQLDNKQSKAAVLSNMAWIFILRGDLERALSLYQESLQLKEQLGDKQGKAVSLYMMAEVVLRRGNYDGALKLYEESLQLLEQLGDKQNRANTLANMARIFISRGDLERALSLYQESLQLLEQLGDKKGKAALLSNLADLYMTKDDYNKAEELLKESLALRYRVGHLDGVAYSLGKLGQIAETRGDKTTALMRYQEALAIFEKLGISDESQQLRQMIASLEGGAVANVDPLAQVIAQARDASQRGNVESAIQYQEQAVSLAREMNNGKTLTAQLVNLAQYYGKAERHDGAVALFEEALKVGEESGHPQVDVIREMLESAKKIALLTPEERAQAHTPESRRGEQEDFETQLQTQLAQLPPEKRAEAETQIRKAYAEFQRMSPEEQARAPQVANDQSNRAQIDNAANKARDAGLAYVRKQAPKKDIIDYLTEMSHKAAEGEKPGSPWLEVAALCDALVALIKEESVPPVPAAYAGHFSAVQSEKQRMKDEG